MAGANYGQAVIAAAQMFLDKVVMYPFIKSKFAILALSNNLKYSQYGENTEIREVTAGKAINYDPVAGWEKGGDAGTVTWSTFKANFDRGKTFMVDFQDEMKSIIQGMEPSTIALLEQFWDAMGAEIDACLATTLYSYVPAANRLLNTAKKVDADSIFDTLLDLKWAIYNKGVSGIIYFFVSSSVMANISKKIADGYGLANPTVLTLNPVVSQEVADRLGEGALDVKLDVVRFADNCIIVPVPDDRMNTLIVLNDKNITGQEAGGWEPATGETGYAHMDVLAIPKDGAFASIRHLVLNISVPASTVGLVNVKSKLDTLNADYYGSSEVRNIGISQDGDWFKSMNRIKHGGGVFNNYANMCYSITDAPHA